MGKKKITPEVLAQAEQIIAAKLGIGPEVLEKARRLQQGEAWNLDPLDINTAASDHHLTTTHPGTLGIDYETLRNMSRVPTIAAIIGTRVNQIAEFATPRQSRLDVGFEIGLRDERATPSNSERRQIRDLTDWIETCGDPAIDPEATFEQFIRKTVRDSLTFDAMTFETLKTRGGKPAGFQAVDAATIRRGLPTAAEKEAGRINTGLRHYVQVMHNKQVAQWDSDSFAYVIRRPRTWIKANDYGYPELEELITVVTNILNAEMYNANNFKHGLHAAGILAMVTKMDPRMFKVFRQEFYKMLQGAANSKRTPLVQLDPEAKEDIKAVNLSMSNKEMEYEHWTAYLLKIACSLFLMDPAELGFVFGAEGQNGSLVQQGPADRIQASREKGLRPLLRAVQNAVNRHIIRKVAPDLMLRFKGFDAGSEQAQLDADGKRVRAFMTPNEIRATYDLDPLGEEGTPLRKAADMVLDATFHQTVNQAEAALMAPSEEGGGGPMPDGAPEDGVPDDSEQDPNETIGKLFGKSLTQPQIPRVRSITLEVV